MIVAQHRRSLQPHWRWQRSRSSLSFSIDNTLDWAVLHTPNTSYGTASCHSSSSLSGSASTQPKPIQPCRQLHRLSSTLAVSQSVSQLVSQSIRQTLLLSVSRSVSRLVSLSIQVRNFRLAVDLARGSIRGRRSQDAKRNHIFFSIWLFFSRIFLLLLLFSLRSSVALKCTFKGLCKLCSLILVLFARQHSPPSLPTHQNPTQRCRPLLLQPCAQHFDSLWVLLKFR